MDFKQLFREIAPEEITDNVFTLVGKIYPVITVRTAEGCNAMVASGG